MSTETASRSTGNIPAGAGKFPAPRGGREACLTAPRARMDNCSTRPRGCSRDHIAHARRMTSCCRPVSVKALPCHLPRRVTSSHPIGTYPTRLSRRVTVTSWRDGPVGVVGRALIGEPGCVSWQALSTADGHRRACGRRLVAWALVPCGGLENEAATGGSGPPDPHRAGGPGCRRCQLTSST